MLPQTRGISSILHACEKEPSVKRLVYTSTVAAVNDDPHLGTGLDRVYGAPFGQIKSNFHAKAIL